MIHLNRNNYIEIYWNGANPIWAGCIRRSSARSWNPKTAIINKPAQSWIPTHSINRGWKKPRAIWAKTKASERECGNELVSDLARGGNINYALQFARKQGRVTRKYPRGNEFTRIYDYRLCQGVEAERFPTSTQVTDSPGARARAICFPDRGLNYPWMANLPKYSGALFLFARCVWLFLFIRQLRACGQKEPQGFAVLWYGHNRRGKWRFCDSSGRKWAAGRGG